MPSKSKIKGSAYERELVHQFIKAGFDAKRAYASNGQSLGLHEEVDLVVNLFMSRLEDSHFTEEFRIQAKRRASLPKYLGLTDNVDAAVFRQNNDESYILMKLDRFLEMIK